MENCNVCWITIGPNQVKVKCNECEKSFHGICVGINKNEFQYMANENQIWLCELCRKSCMTLNNVQTADPLSETSAQSIANSLVELKTELLRTREDLKKTLEYSNNLNEKLTSTVNDHTMRLQGLMERSEEILTRMGN